MSDVITISGFKSETELNALSKTALDVYAEAYWLKKRVEPLKNANECAKECKKICFACEDAYNQCEKVIFDVFSYYKAFGMFVGAKTADDIVEAMTPRNDQSVVSLFPPPISEDTVLIMISKQNKKIVALKEYVTNLNLAVDALF